MALEIDPEPCRNWKRSVRFAQCCYWLILLKVVTPLIFPVLPSIGDMHKWCVCRKAPCQKSAWNTQIVKTAVNCTFTEYRNHWLHLHSLHITSLNPVRSTRKTDVSMLPLFYLLYQKNYHVSFIQFIIIVYGFLPAVTWQITLDNNAREIWARESKGKSKQP